MKNENDELLKNQIGNIGGLEEQVNSLEGKKLKHTPGAQKEYLENRMKRCKSFYHVQEVEVRLQNTKM